MLGRCSLLKSSDNLSKHWVSQLPCQRQGPGLSEHWVHSSSWPLSQLKASLQSAKENILKSLRSWGFIFLCYLLFWYCLLQLALDAPPVFRILPDWKSVSFQKFSWFVSSVSYLLSSNNGTLLIKNSIGKIPFKLFLPVNMSIVLAVYVHNNVTWSQPPNLIDALWVMGWRVSFSSSDFSELLN